LYSLPASAASSFTYPRLFELVSAAVQRTTGEYRAGERNARMSQTPTIEPAVQSLPESAYKPLKKGETFQPLIGVEVKAPELTGWAMCWGILFCVIFSVASAYSALKGGQGMDAAIPISILTIGLAGVGSARFPCRQ
jgi:hypothetical protein